MKTMLAALALLAVPALAQDPEGWPTPLPAKALEFHLLEQPARVLDTRQPGCQAAVTWPSPDVPCPGGALRDGETRHLQLQATWLNGVELMPLGARGVLVTLTAVGGTGPGHLLLFNPYPASGPSERPVASSLNFPPGQAVAAGVTSALGQWQFQTPSVPFAPDLALYARVSGGGEVHVVLDVVGYYSERP